MNYDRAFLKHHYSPSKGWINDPNGLVWFDGYYHLFYQHSPGFEDPWHEPMHWGHARTKNFSDWEELPVALYPDMPYDCDGCWSGTAIVKDDVLYLYYASIRLDEFGERVQTVSVAYSKDGINFTKYHGNPVIASYPADGGPDFRDPAVAFIDGRLYCVMATGHRETAKGRLLLYEGSSMYDFEYRGIMMEWDNCEFTECPSFMAIGDKCLLSVSVCPLDKPRYFQVMAGSFADGVFVPEIVNEADRGPDQYAGQIFKDIYNRAIMITWIPGWDYIGFAKNDIGCMSVPREIVVRDNKIFSYPVRELQHLLKSSDEALDVNESGFCIKRKDREAVEFKGDSCSVEVIRDEYIMEVFVNKGERVYTLML